MAAGVYSRRHFYFGFQLSGEQLPGTYNPTASTLHRFCRHSLPGGHLHSSALLGTSPRRAALCPRL
ncbi:hypothetical protein SBA3_1820060 [Candidatus Sulfopaludibacter sp. SbA3]|nr:hypothetical protein SBA3_1820060 [Candidatus Sulfopaludibacter sp. SbA3]